MFQWVPDVEDSLETVVQAAAELTWGLFISLALGLELRVLDLISSTTGPHPDPYRLFFPLQNERKEKDKTPSYSSSTPLHLLTHEDSPLQGADSQHAYLTPYAWFSGSSHQGLGDLRWKAKPPVLSIPGLLIWVQGNNNLGLWKESTGQLEEVTHITSHFLIPGSE